MDLKDQLCNLELARELKELGIKQESYWYWYEAIKLVGEKNELREVKYWVLGRSRLLAKDTYSAFTVAELGEMLPKDFMSYKKENDMWLCCKHHIDTGKDNQLIEEFADTEANARAKMLIYLLENKLIGEG